METVVAKISAKRVTVAQSPIAWCVGLMKEFVIKDTLPPRAKLTVEDGKIKVIFGEEGSKFTLTNSGMYSWATFSSLWIGDLQQPSATMTATLIPALFDPETFKIEFDPAHYTTTMLKALTPAPAQQSMKELEDMDTFKVKPRIGSKIAVRKITKDESKLLLGDEIVPERIIKWTDKNVKNLKALINDLQAKRRDIVIHIVNGEVVMHKQILEEI